jgi:hypothetical protein
VAVVGLTLLVAVAPLVVFTRRLRSEKARGIFHYGELGRQVGLEFEKKWFDQGQRVDRSVLQVEDFSTMTDLYQVVENVSDMRDVPFGLTNLQSLVLAAIVPFVPVALMSVPLHEILEKLAKLIL